MSCEWREKVGPYVDDELAGTGHQEFSRHVTGCQECTSAVAEQMSLKKAVRVAGNRFSAPPELHAAIYRQLHPRRSASQLWKWATAAAGLAVLVLAVMLVIPHDKADSSMMAGLVDQHVIALASPNPVDVASEDRHTVKPWFQGRIPFTFNPPELAGSSFKLIGGKQVFVQQKPGAELLYTAGAHKISIFIFQARPSNSGSRSPSWTRSQSFNTSTWQDGPLDFYLVTDANKDEASRLVDMFREANRS
jgi:anti-sigma factor RsiW